MRKGDPSREVERVAVAALLLRFCIVLVSHDRIAKPPSLPLNVRSNLMTPAPLTRSAKINWKKPLTTLGVRKSSMLTSSAKKHRENTFRVAASERFYRISALPSHLCQNFTARRQPHYGTRWESRASSFSHSSLAQNK